MKTLSESLTDFFIQEIKNEFRFPLEGRLQILADVDHYKASEDHSVWLQKQQKAPEMAEVYWDGEWIMDFQLDTEKSIIFAIFWNGFYKAYEQNRIRLNQGLADTEFKDINVMIESNKKKLPKPQTALEKEAEKIIAEIKEDSNGTQDATRSNPGGN